MNIHRNARTCPKSRALLVRRIQSGWTVAAASQSLGISRTTGHKWLSRHRRMGDEGLQDRSSRPEVMPTRISPDREEMAVSLRRLRMSGKTIAKKLRMSRSTVSRILRRRKLSRHRDIEAVPIYRYEREHPGDLIHLDIKKLGRFKQPGHRVLHHRQNQSQSCGIGWEFVHVAIDDASRLAYAEVLEDEKGATCSDFFKRAIQWFGELGVPTRRVMTDNGSGYRSKNFRSVVAQVRAKHIFTKPYTPRTNGKAERFIQTLLREWAYARIYRSSEKRRALLPTWLKRYNFKRPHGSLGDKPPFQRLLTTS